jgi:hypothetical protein
MDPGMSTGEATMNRRQLLRITPGGECADHIAEDADRHVICNNCNRESLTDAGTCPHCGMASLVYAHEEREA